MPGPILKCSGRAWLQSLMLWSAFGFLVGVLVRDPALGEESRDLRAGTPYLEAAVEGGAEPNSGRLVSVTVSELDLGGLGLADFGDIDEPAPAR